MNLNDDPGLKFVAGWFQKNYGTPLPEPTLTDAEIEQLMTQEPLPPNQSPMLPAEETQPEEE